MKPHSARFPFPEFLQDLGLSSAIRLESCWTIVNGLNVHSRSSIIGGGIPFVLIHGLVISSLYMIPLAEELAGEYPVHAIDLPGFGRSGSPAKILSVPQLADAVLDWMTAAGIDRCHLLGNSLGCEIAAHVAVKAPERVVSMVLVGPTLDPRAFAVFTQAIRLLWDAFHEPPRLWLNWFFDFCRAGLSRTLGTTREMFRDHIERQLPNVKAPTLMIRGEHDPTVPQRAAEKMATLTPSADLLVIAGGWHCVHYTAPEVICNAVKTFVRDAVICE